MSQRFWRAVAVMSLLFCGVASSAQTRVPLVQNRLRRGDPNYVLMAQMRAAGLNRDRTQVERLLRVAADGENEKNILVALRALSRMGEERALPIFDAVDALISQPTTRKFFQVMRSRLFVEKRASGRKSSSLAEARTRLAMLLAHLDYSPDEFKKKYHDNVENQVGVRGNVLDDILLSLREIADVIYAHRDTFLLQAVEEAELDLKTDPLVALKIRLAFLSTQERINALIVELSRKEYVGYLDFEDAAFAQRLLVDIGETAQSAITNRLEQLRGNRAEKDDEFTVTLISTYAMFPTNRQASIVNNFRNDRNERVRGAAEVLERRMQKNEPHSDLITWRY